MIVVAPTGAGKSTFVRRHFRPTEIVSSDRCRALVSDDEADQRATCAAFEVFHAIIRGRMQMGRLAVADATNLEAAARAGLATIAREHARPVVTLVLDVPWDRAVAQNSARRRRVPDRVLDLHFSRFAEVLRALVGEGYDQLEQVVPGAAIRIVRSPAPQGESSTAPG